MAIPQYKPIAIFDTLNDILELYHVTQNTESAQQPIRNWFKQSFKHSNIKPPSYAAKDALLALRFLYNYRGSKDTFSSYRRELERLLQWSWFVKGQSILKHKREDIEAFVEFCINPYKRWISLEKATRFQLINGEKRPHPKWRPFEVRLNKSETKAGKKPTKNNYQLSAAGLKAVFAILSSFYNYLLQEDLSTINPVTLIRQKSKFLQKEASQPVIRRLSEKQWQTMMCIAKKRASKNIQYERDVFILSCLYGMYLRISELITTPRWAPTMGDFFQDRDNNWWFKTVGKGNKARQIAVSNAMLNALIRYRNEYLKLRPYPDLGETTPLIGHCKNYLAPITSDYPIRQLVQTYFDLGSIELEKKGEVHEANRLRSATVHWLRHTGISEDVKHRPREHVRDDAGHSSSAITDRYIDIELKARAESAKQKSIDKETRLNDDW